MRKTWYEATAPIIRELGSEISFSKTKVEEQLDGTLIGIINLPDGAAILMKGTNYEGIGSNYSAAWKYHGIRAR